MDNDIFRSVIDVAIGVVAAVAAYLWTASARVRLRAWRKTQRNGTADAQQLARTAYRQHIHAALLYLVAIAMALGQLANATVASILGLGIVVPFALTLMLARDSRRDARLFVERLDVVRRAQEVFEQEELATKRWAARLVPKNVPSWSTLDVGLASRAGAGMMTGDFVDIVELTPTRRALVIGDAAGHGVDASITAFQAKYVLRSYLRRFRDPAQVLDELNKHMSALSPDEELMSVLVVVIDDEIGTLRYASAGHNTCYATQDRDPIALRSTGPLLMLDPEADYASREIPFSVGETVVLYTDGVIESRSSNTQFGAERVVSVILKELSAPPETIAKALLAESAEFSDGESVDDTTILVARRT